MSWVYPRDRKKIDVLNGIWDPMDDQTFSKSLWTPTHRSSAYSQWDMLSAPGGVGGYALWMKGEIQDNIDMRGVTGVSSYRPEGYLYAVPVLSQYRWKITIEFRLRIVSDQGSPLANREVSHSAGFALDGNTIWPNAWVGYPTSQQARVGVYFNVANQKAGIARQDSQGATIDAKAHTFYDVAWSGILNTWYDIRIEYEHNIWTNNWYFPIKVYVNNSNIIDTTIYFNDWRTDDAAAEGYSCMLGRPGPQIINENDDTVNITNGTFVEAYWKDILITNEMKLVSWEYRDAIYPNENLIYFKGLANATYPESLSKGSDIQIWRRTTTSDPWTNMFRGIIRSSSRPLAKLTRIQAEGYGSFLSGEKKDSLSFTTQKAETIIAGAINDPHTKSEFDVTTYFETTTPTYTRKYMQVSNKEIIGEMMALADKIVFLDAGNNWHFESYRANELNIHLEWGKSRIFGAKVEELFAGLPNILRVYGSGVMAEKELAIHKFDSGSQIVKAINRLDLTAQAEVDAALDYYATVFSESIRVVELKLVANFALKKGHLISVTVPREGINHVQFLINTIACTSGSVMTLQLVEAKPIIQFLLADLQTDVDSKASEMYPEDTHAADDLFNFEATLNTYIGVEYEVIYNSVVQRSGHGQITQECINAIIDLWYDDTNVLLRYIGHGTGTTEPLFSDNALETQTARPASVESMVGKLQSAMTGFEAYADITSPTNMSELGLFPLSAGGNMFARAVFAPYTQTGSVRIKMTIRAWPELDSNYMNFYGIFRILYRFYQNGGIFNEPDYLRVKGSETFMRPQIMLDRDSEYNPSGYSTTYQPVSGGTYSRTKLYDRNMLRLDHSGTFGTGMPDVLVNGLCMLDGVLVWVYFWCFLRRNVTLGDLDSKNFKWKVFLKFTPGARNIDAYEA